MNVQGGKCTSRATQSYILSLCVGGNDGGRERDNVTTLFKEICVLYT